jgi:GNAT superfamily N-acetyltransferase
MGESGRQGEAIVVGDDHRPPPFRGCLTCWPSSRPGDDGAVVGIITLAEAQATHGSPFYDRPDVASFGQFAVLPALQRQGIGSRLMDIVEARAREKGVIELALDTSEHAQALIAMYTKRGYRFIEYSKWDIVNYRSVILSKSLG